MTDNSQIEALRLIMTKPNLARDGASKRTVDSIPVKPGMKNRTAETSLLPGHNNPLDDEKYPPLDKKLTPVTINPGTPSHPQRGEHVEGQHSAVLIDAANLGKPVIEDKANGRSSGGSRPVTTQS